MPTHLRQRSQWVRTAEAPQLSGCSSRIPVCRTWQESFRAQGRETTSLKLLPGELSVASARKLHNGLFVTLQQTGEGPLWRNHRVGSRTPAIRGDLRGRHTRPYFFLPSSSPVSRTARKAFCGMSTCPIDFIRFLPAFCFSQSLRLRLISPP